MSTKLLKRVLRKTAADLLEEEERETAERVTLDSGKRKRRKRGTNYSQDQSPFTKDDLINRQVKSILSLDHRLNKRRSIQKYKAKAVERLERESKQKSKSISKSKTLVLGNSRSSVKSQLSSKQHSSIPTFNKHQYKKQQEEKKVAAIAKLLNRQSKGLKKKEKKKGDNNI